MVETERRASSRIRVYRPVRLRQPTGLSLMETLSKDLAEGGVRCLSEIPLPVATPVVIEVSLSAGELPLELHGKTAWTRSLPHSEQFEIGIAFLEISPQTKRRLSGCLERLSRHPDSISV